MLTDDTIYRVRSLNLARILATQAHSGQVDKSGYPYIDHCRRVANSVEGIEAKTVAWLHDVLEDTNLTESDLRASFDTEVVGAVVALTHLKGERNDIYWERIRHNALARKVKIEDIHDNIDPIRLALLDSKTVNRLVAKYNKALALLQ